MMEARINQLERDRATDAEKVRTLIAANQTVCIELSKASIAMNQLKTEIAVLVATMPTKEENEAIDRRVTVLEMEKAKQDGGIQVGKYLVGAGCTLFGILIAKSDKIAAFLKL